MLEEGTKVVVNAPGATGIHGETGVIKSFNPASDRNGVGIYTVMVKGLRHPSFLYEDEVVPIKAPERPEPKPNADTITVVTELLADAEADVKDTTAILAHQKKRVEKIKKLLTKMEGK